MKRAWTRGELRRLTMMWGEKGLAAISRRLGRTPAQVVYMARKQGLTGGRHGLLTIEEVSRRTGFHRSTILRCLARLGMVLRPYPTICHTQAKRRRAGKIRARFGLDEELLPALSAYMLSREMGSPIMPGTVLMRSGWGEAGRPVRCAGCGETKRPHMARGLCVNCYRRKIKAWWGRGGRPEACLGCGETERPHIARGCCGRCYRRKLAQKDPSGASCPP